jgi:hypothetical protein
LGLRQPVYQVLHMADTFPREFFIQGVTNQGKTFRPSDWSERLCGVMSAFGPGASGANARLKYSLYVRPEMFGNVKCVVVDERLRDLEPMAFDFVMNFARDNDLLVTEGCSIPDHAEAAAAASGKSTALTPAGALAKAHAMRQSS